MLLFIRESHKDNKYTYAVFSCSFCGTEVTRRVRKDQSNSCGCRVGNWRHGHEVGRVVGPELKTYRKMKERCLSTKCPDYPNYGGRGIAIDPRWIESFDNFLSDMGRRPAADSTLERLNVNGNYEPSNCVWLPKKLQNKNMRSNVRVEIEGRNEIVTDWLKELKISRSVYYRYIKKTGASHLDALLKLRK